MRFIPKHIKRQTWAGAQCAIPEISAFGWNKQLVAHSHGLDPHQHDLFELCCIIKGSVQWWAGDNTYKLSANDIYITKPGEMHGGIDQVLHPSEIYWLLPLFPKTAPLPGLTKAQTRALHTGLQNLTLRTFPGSPHTIAAFQDIHRELALPSPGSQVIIRSAFQRLLVEILRDHDRATRKHAPQLPSPPILAVKNAIDQNPGKPLSVDEMASIAGLGISRFHERFAKETGVSPADYRHRARISKARDLLTQTSQPITRIALALGFASSQHFAASFRKFVGQTPSHYRRHAKPGF